MNKVFQIGVLGCASIAERMVIPAILQSPHFNLVAIASRDAEKAQRFAEKFQCDAMTGYENLLALDTIEVVYIPLPTGLHHHYAMKALNSGKHVLLEKSLASTYNEAKEIIALAQQKNLLVCENFMFAYHRQFEKIKSIIESGRLGQLRCIRSSFGFPPFADSTNIRYQPNLGGGALLDAGAYTLKVAMILREMKPQLTGSSLHVDQDRGVDVFGGILMTYPDGCVVETAFGFDHFYQCSLEIWGNEGKLTAHRIFTAGPGIRPQLTIETKSGIEQIEIDEDNHFIKLLNNFARCADSGNFEEAYQEIDEQAKMLFDVLTQAKVTR